MSKDGRGEMLGRLRYEVYAAIAAHGTAILLIATPM